jgi:peptide/nickel transport system substrate-binding protein/microcin C transport system substrate-binding protein
MGFWHRSTSVVVLGAALVGAQAAVASTDAVAGKVGRVGVAGPAQAGWSHAFAMYGTPKYPAGFAHYDYVNPEAPKGGTLNLGNPDRGTSFSTLNPYLLNTAYSFGTYFFSFETLCDQSEDEAGVMYGLVAEAILVAPDLSSVSFRINPRAHFNNGDPVTAADVKYSFDTLVSDQANPGYAATLALASRAVVVDSRTVRFDLTVRSRDSVYTLGTFMPVFSPKWGMGADGKRKPFAKIIDDIPIATGAYVVAKTYNGRRIDLVRDPNYWARDEGVRRGFYNFDKIVYRYYADAAVQFEALKAGDIDLFWETNLKRWGRQFKGDKFGPGKIIVKALPTGQGTYARALILNLRRPKFQDARVREALQLSFDFEWLNAQNFNLFAHVDSAFSNSEFAAGGLPSPGELAILEPFRDRLPAAVFGPPYVNPRSDTSPLAMRDNLKRARDLLAEAGWRPGADRVLRNERGEAFSVELLNDDPDIGADLEPWLVNLARLGIDASVRQVDAALFSKRLQVFDFDVTELNYGEFLMPSPTLLKSFYASDQVGHEGSYNYGGIADPALDAALAAMDAATTLEALRDATRAFDRVFMQQHYVVPWSRRPAFNAAWRDRFGMPAQRPRYFTLINDTNNAEPWPIQTWWAITPNASKR